MDNVGTAASKLKAYIFGEQGCLISSTHVVVGNSLTRLLSNRVGAILLLEAILKIGVPS